MLKKHDLKTNEYRPFRALHYVLIVALFSGAVFFVEKNTTDFQASVIPTKQALPFDGTVTPVQRVPKWTSLTSDQYKLPYDSIPADKLVSLPVYNADELKTPVEQLGWKTDKDLAIRNEKITFSTPYMGDYKLDGIENAGSHLAVDIKVPMGTPVYAIANGIATQVVDQTTGFGKHIVIQHQNVPSLDDPNKKVTLYSSYNHLSELLISEGDVVTKGQLIAKSGESGTATTPHVHFQIDNSDAPWHPYWPFTYQEATAAGLDFTSAIDAGLGKDKALKTTINPMMYVQKYLTGSPVASSSTTTSSSSSTSSTSTSTTSHTSSTSTSSSNPGQLPPPLTTTTTSTPVVTQQTQTTVQTSESTAPVEVVTEQTTPPEKPPVAFEVDHDGTFVKNAEETITVKAVDQQKNVVKSYVPNDNVAVKILVGGADLPAEIPPSSFTDGVATFKMKPTANSSIKLMVSDNTLSGESDVMLPADSFPDVSSTDTFAKAVSFLRDQQVIAGYSDGTFKPNKVVSRVEAVKFILKGMNSSLVKGSNLPFKDTNSAEWYADFVATAYNLKLINGYSDGSFKPANTVNRAEFLKMLLLAIHADVNMSVPQDVYQDVPKDAWYAPYVQYAREKNLVTVNGTFFKPEVGMTRGEVADVLYRAILLRITGADSFSDNLTVTKSDLSSFYS